MAKWARWESPGVPEIFDGGRDIVTGAGKKAVLERASAGKVAGRAA